MTDARRAELERDLVEKAKELRELVGNDLPKDGYIQINVWSNSIMGSIEKDWETRENKDDRVLAFYVKDGAE